VAEPDDPIGAAARALGGKADIVIECVGRPGLIAQAVEQVRPRGTILLLGLCTQPDSFNSFAMLSKEVRLVTSAFFHRQEYEAALDALCAGALELRHLVSDTIGLAETPDRFEALRKRTHDCKVLINPLMTSEGPPCAVPFSDAFWRRSHAFANRSTMRL